MVPPICISNDKIKAIDSHLMYYPWRLYVRTTEVITRSNHIDLESSGITKAPHPTKSFEIEPILVRSARPLRRIRLEVGASGSCCDSLPLLMKLRAIWIHHGSPAIEVSEEELASLSFFLGIIMGGPKYLPSGRGAFNDLVLLANSLRGMSVLRLASSAEGGTRRIRGCSGYSTLFAKHLACGCIPFARTYEPTKVIHTVAITETAAKLIRDGQPICDINGPPEAWGRVDPRAHFMEKMPSWGRINYYHETLPHSVTSCHLKGMTGQIWHVKEKGKPSMAQMVGSWPDAVAQIAFGGLAPLVSEKLHELIVFTIGGKVTTGEELAELHRIMMILEDDIFHVTKTKDFRVFGRKSLEGYNIDTQGMITNACHQSLRSVVSQLKQLGTMLEVLIAKVDTSPSDSTFKNQFRLGESKRDRVFKCCADEIKLKYEAQIHQEPIEERITVLLSKADVIETLKHRKPVSAEQCGTVARCIIMAWATFVKIVDWSDNEPEKCETASRSTISAADEVDVNMAAKPANLCSEADIIKHLQKAYGSHKKNNNTLQFRPISLDDLPDVAAWE
jgi:hypothetical protein